MLLFLIDLVCFTGSVINRSFIVYVFFLFGSILNVVIFSKLLDCLNNHNQLLKNCLGLKGMVIILIAIDQ